MFEHCPVGPGPSADSGCPPGGKWPDDRISDRSQLRELGALFCKLHRLRMFAEWEKVSRCSCSLCHSMPGVLFPMFLVQVFIMCFHFLLVSEQRLGFKKQVGRQPWIFLGCVSILLSAEYAGNLKPGSIYLRMIISYDPYWLVVVVCCSSEKKQTLILLWICFRRCVVCSTTLEGSCMFQTHLQTLAKQQLKLKRCGSMCRRRSWIGLVSCIHVLKSISSGLKHAYVIFLIFAGAHRPRHGCLQTNTRDNWTKCSYHVGMTSNDRFKFMAMVAGQYIVR